MVAHHHDHAGHAFTADEADLDLVAVVAAIHDRSEAFLHEVNVLDRPVAVLKGMARFNGND
jgi:hypothetical protein